MCPECVGNGISSDGKAICAECAPGTLRNAMAQLKSQRWRNKLKLCLSGGIVGLGICIAIVTMIKTGGAGVFDALFVILFACGVVGVFSLVKTDQASMNSRTLLFAVGRPEVVAAHGCVSVIVSFIGGIIVAPMNIYRYYLSLKTNERQIREYEELLAPYITSSVVEVTLQHI
jgi:hypothetical protein